MKSLPYLDGEQLLEDLMELAKIGDNPMGGINRIAFSPTDMEGRAWVAQKMEAAGLTLRTDAAGNTIGLYPGTEALPPIAIGSHTDTVPEGGAYDGALGVLAAIAGIRALQEAGQHLRHPVEVINFVAEEATMSGGTLGSKAMTERILPGTLAQAAWDGRTVSEHLSLAGIDPSAIAQAKRADGSLAGFIELHVEQSDTLVANQTQIAVVEGIVGIRRYAVTFPGYANHAGTTTMTRRQDALVAAAPYILSVEAVAVAHGIVGTIGNLVVKPGAPNVIPGQVDITLEIRGLSPAVLDQAEAKLAQEAQAAGASFTPVSNGAPVESDPRLVDALVGACDDLGLSYLKMPSGAGHDAMNMAYLCPQAMLFVPSQGGVSHSPDEYTAPQDCINGAQVLLAALIRADEVL